MEKVLYWTDRRKKLEEAAERLRHLQEVSLREKVERELVGPVMRGLKLRRFTRIQAKTINDILLRAFRIEPFELEPDYLNQAEYDWRDQECYRLVRYFFIGDLLIHQLIVLLQEKAFYRSKAIRLLRVARLWYKEVF